MLLPTALSVSGCDSAGLVIIGEYDNTDVEGTGLVEGDDLFTDLVSEDSNDFVEPDYGHAPAELPIGAALPTSADANNTGEWSNSFAWPLSPIHATLLPSGSVLTYGTNGSSSIGGGGRGFDVDRWIPESGTGASSHQTTPTGIDTNIFCSAQMVLPDEKVLLTGGDAQPNGQNIPIRNNGVNATTIYDPVTNQLSDARAMNFARWYPTIIPLGSGQQLVVGGRTSKATDTTTRLVPAIPELYNPRTGKWRLLNGARSDSYYARSWWYPRAFLNKRGRVIMFKERSGEIYELDPRQGGSFRKVTDMPSAFGTFGASLPAAMYEDGKIMVISNSGQMGLVDTNANPPRVSLASPTPGGPRFWSDATVLATGKVLITGGSTVKQNLNAAVHEAQIWDPATDTWQTSKAANGRKARLYHSTSILLPDASVLVAGGGPPGPATNLNANIYYPPYLYDDAGNEATRPEIIAFSGMVRGDTTSMQVNDSDTISAVTLVKAGSVTHSFDQGQRKMSLAFRQQGNTVTATIPTQKNRLPPGLYMMFIINDKGVPSEARVEMLR